MISAERERFRLTLLQQLAAGGDLGLALSTLVQGAKLADFTEADEAITRGELVYLQDKQLVQSVNKLLSPENKRWRILAAGRDYLAELGF